MNYFCCDNLRRDLLRGSALNGIDYLEVLDRAAPVEASRQRTLFVHFLNPLTTALEVRNVRIEGGERITGIRVVSVTVSGDPRLLTVEVDPPGDFSAYQLRLIRDRTDDSAPEGIDPLFATVEFSFKVECPSEFDCQTLRVGAVPEQPSLEIDYLAKDYATFRRLMLDRLAALMPQWRERNAADLGVAMVELLAYVGDHLSYLQDAVGTEAYLATARRRISVRRHARLVDYFMHDGGNARAWVQITIEGADHVLVPQGTPLLSRLPQVAPRISPDQLPGLLKQHPIGFETMAEALLFAAHNEIELYSWGNERCCLPQGSMRASLRDKPESRLRLRVGDVLIFEERIGPVTLFPEDADPERRHAVRLTRVQPEAVSVFDDHGREIDRVAPPIAIDALVSPAVGVVQVEWGVEDALPFALCLSALRDEAHHSALVQNVSVALGNIVLADHGLSQPIESLGPIPPPSRYRSAASHEDRCAPRDRIAVPARFNPTLNQYPITHAAPLPTPATSAQAAMSWSTRDLLPAITLVEKAEPAAVWHPRRDLLGSDEAATEFVVETEHDGAVSLRFGDGEHGLRPQPDTEFTARYRTGNGVAGNVGAGAIGHIQSTDSAIVGVRNPLPACGGVEPESVEAVRQNAPSAFRTQQRAVTEADYAEVAGRDARVQQAKARQRWTGSWHTVFIAVDPLGGRTLDRSFEAQLEAHVDRFRMAGHDLEIDRPVFVPLEIDMLVCVRADYFRAAVKQALLALFSNRALPNADRGLFHPDNFSFGQTVYLSPLYAAAQQVPGVASVRVTTFKRRLSTDRAGLDRGFLQMGRMEIAQLDNDRNFAERGVFRLTMGGGR